MAPTVQERPDVAVFHEIGVIGHGWGDGGMGPVAAPDKLVGIGR